MTQPTPPDLGQRIGATIRSTARAFGWSQRELAARLGTNQSAIRRLYRGGPLMDVRLAGAAMDLLGIRLSIDANPIGLAGRREQADAVHARCCAHVVGQLTRRGWQTGVEVEIGEGRFRGWIDILAFRPSDRAMLVVEVKTEIDDLGRTLRSLGWYARTSRDAAVRLGWQPRRIVPILLALATTDTDARLTAARDLLRSSLPGGADALAAWIDDAAATLPAPSLALIDPRRRRRAWLIRLRSDGRKTPAPYPDLRKAAAVLSPTMSPRPSAVRG